MYDNILKKNFRNSIARKNYIKRRAQEIWQEIDNLEKELDFESVHDTDNLDDFIEGIKKGDEYVYYHGSELNERIEIEIGKSFEYLKVYSFAFLSS